MANPGVGNKFVSVNLNKSYGQSNQSHGGASHYGLGRGRSGGGGMVVLSRPRSSHKAGTKLSVPPPLNLPSLRKEHERFDSLGTGSGPGGGVVPGGGARPSSSGVGWSKPSAVVPVEREGVGGGDRPLSSDGVDHVGGQMVDGSSRGGAVAYMPPSARSGVAGPDVSAPAPLEKATVLRGEDFPSLKATLAAGNGSVQKQRDSGHQKQRQGVNEEYSAGGLKESSSSGSRLDMRPQLQSSQHSVGNGITGGSNDDRNPRPQEQGRKRDDYFPGPLPLVRLSPRSDWEDDERNTSHGFTERGRENGTSRIEAYWDDRDFDLPRSSFLPHKPVQNYFDRRGLRDNDVVKGSSNEVTKADPFGRDVRVPSREGREVHPSRTASSRDGFSSQAVVSNRNSLGARPGSDIRECIKENKYMPSQVGGITREEHNSGVTLNRDFSAGRRDSAYVQGGRQQWNNSVDSSNSRAAERNLRDHYGSDSARYKVDTYQNNMGSRSSFPAGGKGFSGGDHSVNFGRDRRSFSRSEKPFVEDPFVKDWGSTGFDGQDPFSSGILGVVKRKKDANKQLDFLDPVRESFEAELERVQKIQEQERQRIIEEQERAMEMARREEEERLRVAREQEEHQRRLEEEAQEAAWRAEQERLEGIQRAEEQRLAREAEKQRIVMEEERRKQAAKQKLLELEEKIARRQAETGKPDSPATVQGDTLPGIVRERDDSRADDFSGWEDGERMVERITNTASSDSSFTRTFDMGSRPAPVRDGSFAFTDRGKQFNAWRRDIFDDGNSSSFFTANHENGHQSPRRDTSLSGRAFPRKDFYGGGGYLPTRSYYQGGIPEPHMDDFPHSRGHRWNISGDGDPYGRNTEMEAELHENFADKFDVGWNQGRGRGTSPFPERLYQNPDLDELSYGRSRYPARQPRVLPPPSLHRTSLRDENEHSGSSTYGDGSSQLSHPPNIEPAGLSFHNTHEEHSGVLDVQEQSAKNGEQELNRSATPGCDSQSSLSVSSPPSSPTQLSHDDLDESKDSVAAPGTAVGHGIVNPENEAALLNMKSGKDGLLNNTNSISASEDEDWTVENNEESQEQEEYDEDSGYHEEEEVNEGDDENIQLRREFEDMHLEGKGSSHTIDNMVLGFDQGVEVGMPNDEFEGSPGNGGDIYAESKATVCAAEQKESNDDSGDGPSPKAADVSLHVTVDSSSITITKNAVQDYADEPNNSSCSKTSLNPVSSGDSPSTVIPAQQPVSSPVGTSSQSPSQGVMPSVAGTQCAAELPVKLQFGLFSGPSLIPSPVPAIQIGSIQMPLQLPPQLGSSLTHMHAPQPPLFQFGQLRYPSPMSQGILPLAPQSMSFVQPSFPSNYPSGQRHGGPPSIVPVQEPTSQGPVKDDQALPPTVINQHVQLSNQLDACANAEPKEANLISVSHAGGNALLHQNQVHTSRASMGQVRPKSDQQTENVGRPYDFVRNSKPLLNNNRTSEGRSQGGQLPVGKGRRFSFTAKIAGSRFSASSNETARSDANGFHRRQRRGTQRFEFRVRQTSDGKQSSALLASNNSGEGKLSFDGKGSGTQPKNGLRKESPSERTNDTEISCSQQITTQEDGSGIGEDRPAGKSTNGHDTTRRAEGSLKRNICSEDDVDAPLQSGIVRVFKQPGIEAPSDEDDFIEVRSKRQMLNDRREQREREIKAKTSNMRKAQQNSRPVPQATTAGRSTGRRSASSSAQAAKSIRTGAVSKRGLINKEMSATINNVTSQPLAPIGTPSMNADSQADGKSQTMKLPQTTPSLTAGQIVTPDVNFVSQSKVPDGVHSSAGSWASSQINQPVMTLTQSQLEEAMRPVQFDKNMPSVGDCSNKVSEPSIPLSSILAKDSPFSSASSPVSSLLAGEKIQFGAVTSPTILPPSTRVVSHSVKPPAATQLDVRISQSMPASNNGCSLLFHKEKRPNEPCLPLEDCEAEAEAAASAIVVAAIGSDEGVGSGIGGCSASISDPKSFHGPGRDGMASGMSSEQQAVGQSKAEEMLSVSLPADLSVETPPISLWPPLPSPHTTTNQVLSPFTGGPTSHFPFYDMNHMMGGPVFAFSPHEESAGSQSQTQKNSAPSSGPLGTWQQCLAGVDSFYGPPARFTTPFISPPGSIPGVQGPPHMLVYNHFAPVGQFGQVGLSYMGTTYLPSGKQPDWKHNPSSSAMGGEGDMNSLNMVSLQRNAPNVAAQVQHLAPGSPLLSMPSPLPMFEVSPFQSAHDASVHQRWSHVPASSIHSVPQSMPLQQPAEGQVCQFNHGSTALTANGFLKPQPSTSLEDGRFGINTSSSVSQFPDELGLVDPPSSSSPEASALVGGTKSQSVSAALESAPAVPEVSGSRRNPQVGHKQKNSSGQHQYNHYQRGGSQRSGSGAEWSNRRMGFHGRNHSSGGERGYPPKVKQIYVAKQNTTSGASAGVQ